MSPRRLAGWIGAGVIGLSLLIWASPRLFPLQPGLTLTRLEARLVALELLRDLGEVPEDAYVVTELQIDSALERRLQLVAGERGAQAVAKEAPAPWITTWRITLWRPGDGLGRWLYRARLGLDGEILTLMKRTGEEPAAREEPLEEAEARRRARAYLRTLGLEGGLAADPEVRRLGGAGETDLLSVRWRHAEMPFPGLDHGRDVIFEGGELRGHDIWYEDAEAAESLGGLASLQIAGMLEMFGVYLIMPLAAFWFLRLYHLGELGVARGARVASVCFAASLAFIALNAPLISSGVALGPVSRRATTLLTSGFIFFFFFSALCVLALTSWSVGEALCRRRWPGKLAAIDAVLRLRWDNATVARSALLAWCGGLAMAGGLTGLAVLGQRLGYWPSSRFMHASGFATPWPGLSHGLAALAVALPLLLFFSLLMPSWALARFGDRRGALFSWAAYALMLPPLVGLPLYAAWGHWMAVCLVPVLLFRQADAAASIGAPLIAAVLVPVGQLTSAQAPSMQLQGWLAILALALPLIASLRHLGGGREFTYSYEDVPVHVRHIAERERHRLELETAREIQAAILPPPPARLCGFEIAHVYLPATEVGGDFFEVRRLRDDRLVLAVGDVAGHGVSSGLVMSMVKAALGIQAEHAPEVAELVPQLNRQVRTGAGRRLLTTLVYCLLDPRDGRFSFACAGHPFPYLTTADGGLRELSSVAYPLGVRDALRPQIETASLGAGDTLVLFSDGLVEARPEGGEEPFGFERLEGALRAAASLSPEGMRDSVLAELRGHTGGALQEDDLTLLLIRQPA